jgi:perosamine synthetase
VSGRLPVAGPWITEAEVAMVAEAARHAWYGRAGEWQSRFEEAFAGVTGRRFALALPSCTSALHLALAALGIGPGDEVIVPECTWIATAAPVAYLGATPVFADIDAETWCLSAQTVAAVLTPRARAIVSVDLYGGMPDYDALEELARRHGVALVEDAAEAVGSRFGGRPAGAFGVASAFSFHGSKTLTTGEGGMLVTSDPALFARAQVLRDHGREPGDRAFVNQEVAYKYKMSAMQAAMGLAQLARLEELVARKRLLFAWYSEELGGAPGVRLNAEPAGTSNSFWMTTIVLDPELGWPKERLMARLDAEGIDSRPFFHPLSSLPAFGSQRPQPVAGAIAPYGVNLPSALCLTREDVARVSRAVREALESARRDGRYSAPTTLKTSRGRKPSAAGSPKIAKYSRPPNPLLR